MANEGKKKGNGKVNPKGAQAQRPTQAPAQEAQPDQSQDGGGEAAQPPAAQPQVAQPQAPAQGGFKAQTERLPPPGTVIQKLDRNKEVRKDLKGNPVQCVVTDDGKLLYNGNTYTSLSKTATAAAEAMGLGSKSLNGWSWWGLETRKRGAGGTSTGTGTGGSKKRGAATTNATSGIEGLDKALNNAVERAEAEFEKPLGKAHREETRAIIAKHMKRLVAYVGAFDAAVAEAMASQVSGGAQPSA